MKKRIISISVIVFIILSFIFQHLWYVDLQNSCSIGIVPSMELSNRNIIRSLGLLKTALPTEYNKICNDVKTINTNVGCGGMDGGCYYGSKNSVHTIYVSTNQRDFLWTANVLVHETCHLRQQKENRPIEERECYKKGDDILNLLTKL